MLWLIVFAGLGSVSAVVTSGLLLLCRASVRRAILPDLLAFATGTLLGAGLLGMVPNALAQASAFEIGASLLAGILTFFTAEKLLVWRHSHEPARRRRGRTAPLILAGDTCHNAADGLVIASAFIVSFPLGVAVSLAVLAHEIPQEIGDFAILLDAGYPPRRAFFWNFLSALATIPAAIVGYLWLDAARALQPFVLAFAAASFLYVAIADLVPSLHRRVGIGATARQVALILAGIAMAEAAHIFA
jgi:zinc and cadmium transporter